ncbi:MAG: type II secretion system F family protein [Negativicutes bacterium]|nr:type II secretion system F family protein [Negativicutes bacterium]
MARTFAYKAKDFSGQLLTGSLVADSEAAVAAYIRGQGYFVTQIKEARQSFFLKEIKTHFQTVKLKDLAIFCRQFATMMDAGLSLIVCLNILLEQTTSPRLKATLRDVNLKVQEGETLSRAMGEHPRVFPDIMVSMVEAGEVGGVMDVVLNRLATHFEKEYKMNDKVRSALTYPAVVLGFAVLVVTFVLVFVLPTFTQMFANMKVQLPLPTRILLVVSDFVRQYGLLVASGLIVIGAGLKIYARRLRLRKLFDKIVFYIPVFGTLARKVAIARFSRMFSTLARGGVPILTALEVVKQTTVNTLMIEALTAAQTSVREGHGLATPLGTSKIFTPMIVQMVAIGEESGELDRMLDKVADFYESDVEDMVGRLSSLLEPALIATLAVIVGFIVLSIALPMFDAITGVGGKI